MRILLTETTNKETDRQQKKELFMATGECRTDKQTETEKQKEKDLQRDRQTKTNKKK
jgi:hypothetical protein